MSDSGKGRFKHWGTSMVSGISVVCRSRVPAVPQLTPIVDISDLAAFDYDFVHERQTVADHDQYLQQKSLPTCEPSPAQLRTQPLSTCSTAATTPVPGTTPVYQMAGRVSHAPTAAVTSSLPAASIVSSITFRAPPPAPQSLAATSAVVAPPVAARHLVSGQVLQPCRTADRDVDAGQKCGVQATGQQSDTLELTAIQNTAIIKDFDASGGEDPFAAAELKTINELEELSSVLWVSNPKANNVIGQNQPTHNLAPVVTTVTQANNVAEYECVYQPQPSLPPNNIAFPCLNSSAEPVALGKTLTSMNQINDVLDLPPDRSIRKSISSISVPDLTVDPCQRAQSVIDGHASTIYHPPSAVNQNTCYQPHQPTCVMLSNGSPWSSPRFTRSFRTSGNAQGGALLVSEHQLAADLHTWAKRHGIDDTRTRRVIQLSYSRSGVQQQALSLEVAKRTLLEQLRTVAILVAERPDSAHGSVAASLWEEAAMGAAVAHWDNLDKARMAVANLMNSYSAVHSMPPTTTTVLINGSLGGPIPARSPLSRSPIRIPANSTAASGLVQQTPSTISDSSHVATFKR